MSSSEESSYGNDDLHVKCRQCPYKTTCQETLRRHINSHVDKRYPCDECDNMFKANASLKRHKKTVHATTIFIVM